MAKREDEVCSRRYTDNVPVCPFRETKKESVSFPCERTRAFRKENAAILIELFFPRLSFSMLTPRATDAVRDKLRHGDFPPPNRLPRGSALAIRGLLFTGASAEVVTQDTHAPFMKGAYYAGTDHKLRNGRFTELNSNRR